jgi:hypothetical protein
MEIFHLLPTRLNSVEKFAVVHDVVAEVRALVTDEGGICIARRDHPFYSVLAFITETTIKSRGTDRSRRRHRTPPVVNLLSEAIILPPFVKEAA